eukprot:3854927-Ditylum_brightwellii.AAC.1
MMTTQHSSCSTACPHLELCCNKCKPSIKKVRMTNKTWRKVKMCFQPFSGNSKKHSKSGKKDVRKNIWSI